MYQNDYIIKQSVASLNLRFVPGTLNIFFMHEELLIPVNSSRLYIYTTLLRVQPRKLVIIPSIGLVRKYLTLRFYTIFYIN